MHTAREPVQLLLFLSMKERLPYVDSLNQDFFKGRPVSIKQASYRIDFHSLQRSLFNYVISIKRMGLGNEHLQKILKTISTMEEVNRYAKIMNWLSFVHMVGVGRTSIVQCRPLIYSSSDTRSYLEKIQPSKDDSLFLLK